MPLDALPPHLQKNPLPAGDKTDHDNRAQRYWNRGWFSFGPRVKKQRWTWAYQGIPYAKFPLPLFPLLAKWRMFPVVLLGYNVTRWMSVEDKSVIFVGRFVEKFISYWTDQYQVPTIEMQPDNPKYHESLTSMIRGRLWWAEKEKYVTQYAYGPSPIQKFALGWSWALTWPLHFAISYRKKREGREDFIFFFRVGARWDSGDMYFGFFDVFLGLTWN